MVSTGHSAMPTDSTSHPPRDPVSPADPPGSRPTTNPVSSGRPIRASDAEREDTVRLLHEALGEGRLDLPETEARVAAACAAVYRGELPELLDDLPAPRRDADTLADRADAPSWQTLWTALVWRARVSLWDGPGAARRLPPGPAQRRLAALLLVLAGLWLLVCAGIGAVL